MKIYTLLTLLLFCVAIQNSIIGQTPLEDLADSCPPQPDQVLDITADIEFEGFPYNSGTSSPVTPSNLNDPRFGELEVHVYINPSWDNLRSPVIIVDGIDFGSTRGPNDIVNDFGGMQGIQELFELGHDVLVVSFVGGDDFIQNNALALIKLIKGLKDGTYASVHSIPGIIGPSMGGQVVRYALCYWEEYLSTGKKGSYGPHNVKTFVSVDSPWLGANVAPSIQCAAKSINDEGNIELLNRIHLMLNSPAARQLLIHHQIGLSGSGLYTGKPHPFRTSFIDELETLGNYPKENNIKIVATANGGNAKGNKPQYLSNIVNLTENDELAFALPDESILFIDKFGHELYARAIQLDNNDENLVDFNGILQGTFPNDIKLVSEIIVDLDSAPGSGFNLKQFKQIEPFVKGGFSFIPTFSALGNRITTPYDELSNFDPLTHMFGFKDVIFNDYNGAHVDLEEIGTKNSTGEIITHREFILDHIGGDQNFELDICNYYQETILGGNDATQSDGGGASNIITYNVNNNFLGNTVSLTNQNFCFTDLSGMLPLNGEGVFDGPNNGVYFPQDNVDNDFCDIYQGWNYAENVPILNIEIDQNTEEQMYCQIKLDICFENPVPNICPNLDIPCEIIILELYINNDFDDYPFIKNDEDATSQNVGLRADQGSTNKNLFSKAPEIQIYPNPSSGLVRMDLPNDKHLISIHNINGALISDNDNISNYYETTLNPGLYIVKIINKDTNEVSTEKLVVQN